MTGEVLNIVTRVPDLVKNLTGVDIVKVTNTTLDRRHAKQTHTVADKKH